MAIAGALIGSALGAFGKKPEVPQLTPIDPNAVQKQTVTGNQANFGDIAKLATSVNTFNQDQLNALIDRVLGPGVRQKIQENLLAGLRGELPQDVMNSIYRSRAGQDVAGNAFAGGGFSTNRVFRDIVGTSYDITQRALTSAEQWLAKASAPSFDVTSMFFTPMDRLKQANLQQQLQYQRDLLAAGVEAAPDPATAALGKEIDRFFNSFANVGMHALGGSLAGDTGTFSNPSAGVGLYNESQANKMGAGLANGIGGLGGF